MKRVLIVSPHFPPTNAADMHRVRHSLRYCAQFGWEPSVLAVDPEFVDGRNEPLLLRTVSPDVEVIRVGALPYKLTRYVGVGAIALRSLPFLYRAGARMISQGEVAL